MKQSPGDRSCPDRQIPEVPGGFPLGCRRVREGRVRRQALVVSLARRAVDET